MNDFVAQCRREWKRLRVPDAIAEEMAAELAADLADAEADGASPQDVLGGGARDARAFATAWAVERGVVHRPPHAWRSRLLPVSVGAALCFAVMFLGAMLVLNGFPFQRQVHPAATRTITISPASDKRVTLVTAPASAVTLTTLYVVRRSTIVKRTPRIGRRTTGAILLALGVVGIAVVVPSAASGRMRRA